MMKKMLITLAMVGLAIYTQAQGVVNFNTRTLDPIARIYDIDGKTPLLGTGYYAQIFAGDGTVTVENQNSLVAKGTPVTFGTTTSSAGYVLTASPVNPTVVVSSAPGLVTIQVRAWSANFSTWDGAQAAFKAADPTAKIGFSNLIPVTSAATIGNPTPPVAPNLVGLNSFNLTVNSVPEPSTIALGVMGLSVLLFRRRK